MQVDEAIILAGGFGTRLQSVVTDVPKPMAAVAGRPFLTYLLDYLRHYGIRHVILSTGYLAEVIENHFGLRYRDVELSYAREETPLGTGGAVRFAMQHCRGSYCWVLNGDSFLDADLGAAVARMRHASADGLLLLRDMPHPDRYGTVDLDEEGRIIAFREKVNGLDHGWINAGVYLLPTSALDAHRIGERFSLEEDYFKPEVSRHLFVGMPVDGYFIDIGIPEAFECAQQDFVNFRYT